MPAQQYLLDNLVADLNLSQKLTKACTKIWVYKSQAIVLEFEKSSELRFAMDLNYSQGIFVGSVLGRSDSSRDLLKKALVGKFEISRNNGERHILGTLKEAEEFPEWTADQCYKWITLINELLDTQILLDSNYH